MRRRKAKQVHRYIVKFDGATALVDAESYELDFLGLRFKRRGVTVLYVPAHKLHTFYFLATTPQCTVDLDLTD